MDIPDSRASDTSPPAYDPGPLLTWFALLLVAGAVVALSVIVGYQIVAKGEADNVWVVQLGGVIGWALAKAGDIYQNRYGTTTQSATKDATIATQARTAAALQGAATTAAIPQDQAAAALAALKKPLPDSQSSTAP